MTITFDSLVGKQMISSDAYDVGEIIDVRYDPFEWNVAGLKIKTKRSEKLAAGIGKGNMMILPKNFVMNDVILLNAGIDKLKDMASPDNNNIPLLSSLRSAKVVSRDNAMVGVATDVVIDTDIWKVVSIAVRLDKTAIEAMGMKKGLFSKINAGIPADMILASKEMIHLSEGMDGIRERMTILE
ncbi:MAG: hypothetical protein FWH44_05000 [Methanomassiliicoccaceae archaeon]|nr:hypothetical protein [Methanomassiliicoccaceae archaeon]